MLQLSSFTSCSNSEMFLCDTVELAPGADSEALDVVRECLQEVFKVKSSTTADGIRPGLL